MNTTDTTEQVDAIDKILWKYLQAYVDIYDENAVVSYQLRTKDLKTKLQALIERQVLQGSIDTIDKLIKELTGRVVHPNDFAAVSSNLLWEKTQLQGQLDKLTETTE